MTWKPTQAQSLVMSALLAILAGAAVASLTAFLQAMQSGNINLQTCLILAMAAFSAVLGPALKNYVPSHAQVEIQAANDTLEQLQDSHSAALAALNNAFSTITALKATAPVQSAPAAPLVVIHAQNAAASPSGLVQPAQVQESPAPLVQPTPPQAHATAGDGADDLLGDLPQQNGVPTTPMQITGRIPTYGQSAQ